MSYRGSVLENYKRNKFYKNVKEKLDSCFLVIKSVETNDISIGDQISNNTFRVNEEAAANPTCSYRRNIQPRLSAIGSVSAKTCKTSTRRFSVVTQRMGVSKSSVHAATKLSYRK